MQHAMTRIAEGATTVMNSKAAGLDHQRRIATLDDKMTGTMLANEIMASAKLEPNIWREYAIRIMNMTAEARTALINALKAEKGAITKGQTSLDYDEKLAKKRTNSATTRVSEMQSFANAWNSGASVTGLMEYINKTSPAPLRVKDETEVLAHVGYTIMLEYARTFSSSKAGRPRKAWLDKVVKFLDTNAPDEDNAADQKLYAELTKLVNAALATDAKTNAPF